MRRNLMVLGELEFKEIGPGTLLTDLIKKMLKGVRALFIFREKIIAGRDDAPKGWGPVSG